MLQLGVVLLRSFASTCPLHCHYNEAEETVTGLYTCNVKGKVGVETR